METEDVEGRYNPKSVAKEVEENLASFQYESTPSYERPLFKKQTTMNFTEKILENLFAKGTFPFTLENCSKCHHCR